MNQPEPPAPIPGPTPEPGSEPTPQLAPVPTPGRGPHPGLTRRTAIKLGAAALAAPLVGAGTTPGRGATTTPAATHPRGRGAKNVIFLVADGMSLGVPSLAEPFSQLVGGAGGAGTAWVKFANAPATGRGFFDMASLNSLVTDSAAASSAWGSGSRVDNGAVNVLPDGTALTPLGAIVKETGRKFGLVTTTRATHATPAGFAAAVRHRDLEDEIATQYLGRADVILGGGSRHFDPEKRADRRDLLAEFAAAGYRIARTRDALPGCGAEPGRILGLFAASHLPFSVDRRADPAVAAAVPTLAAMTRAALALLAPHPAGFLLQIEGGRVDHAAHANDAAAILHDQLAFDDALAVALEFAAANPDTLVIATTDHGNANPGLNGMGPAYAASNACFALVARATASTEKLQPRCATATRGQGAAETAASIRQILGDGLGFPIASEDAQALADLLRDGPQRLPGGFRGPDFAGLLGRIAGRRHGIGWTGTAHTADWAPLLATGPGADRFAGLLPNTAAFAHLVELLGGTFRNPGMTPAEALKFRPLPGTEAATAGGE